jgi:hypothetical protein
LSFYLLCVQNCSWHTSFPMAGSRKKYGRAAIISFGSSAISFMGDPPLSALSLRGVRLFGNRPILIIIVYAPQTGHSNGYFRENPRFNS